MRHFWLLTSLIILFSTPALAQKAVKIGGTVTDENGNPMFHDLDNSGTLNDGDLNWQQYDWKGQL